MKVILKTRLLVRNNLVVCLLATLSWSQASKAQTAPLIFETTFNCPDWDQSMGLSDAAVCLNGDGISGSGAWTTSNGRSDQITAAANNPAGSGKGLRHYRGDGTNNNGGGVRITLASSVTEMWVRWYMRYSSGFAWTPSGQPIYTKDHFWNNLGHPALIVGIQGKNSWGVNQDGGTNYSSSLTWTASQGGPTGDGQFHCYEYHVKQNGSAATIEMWIDDVRYLNTTSANLASTPWSYFTLGANQSTVTGAGAGDYYTDYDDIAISGTGQVGCLGSVPPMGLAAPKNLRFQ